MNLLTLFGGLALVVALYAAGGILRLSGGLRALIAALPPLLAYLFYAAWRWPGLDMAAIHVAVFLSAALALHMLARRGTVLHHTHWIPRLFVAFLVLLVALNAGFLYIATHGLPPVVATWILPDTGGSRVHTAFSGVVGHGREAAKAQSTALSHAHLQAQLNWRVEPEWPAARVVGAPVELRAKVVSDHGVVPGDIRVRVHLMRSGKKTPESSMALHLSETGHYSGTLVFPAPGRWWAELEAHRGDVRILLSHEWVIPDEGRVP